MDMTATGGRGGNETGKPSYYVVRVDSVEGEVSTRQQFTGMGMIQWNVAALYAVVKVDDSGAHVVDDMYRDVDEALKAWPEAAAPLN